VTLPLQVATAYSSDNKCPLSSQLTPISEGRSPIRHLGRRLVAGSLVTTRAAVVTYFSQPSPLHRSPCCEPQVVETMSCHVDKPQSCRLSSLHCCTTGMEPSSSYFICYAHNVKTVWCALGLTVGVHNTHTYVTVSAMLWLGSCSDGRSARYSGVGPVRILNVEVAKYTSRWDMSWCNLVRCL